MRHIKGFVNKKMLDFIEIGSYDESELSELELHSFRNVSIELDALKCLRFFPNIENLILRPGEICEADLSYLSGLPIASLKLDYYSDCIDLYTIDLSQFPNLQFLFSRTQYNFSNVALCRTLCTLVVQEWYSNDLTYLGKSNLQALHISSGKLKSFEGVQMMPQLISISVSYQKSLSDVHHLKWRHNLESLSIEKCNRINILQIPALPNLHYLELSGSQVVDNLSFLRNYPELNYLLLDINVSNGDLQLLLELKHCAIMSNRRHYSLRNADLPKSPYLFHSDKIPHWLEILPEATR